MQEEGEWEENTQLPYDAFASCAVLRDHVIDCPNCGNRVVARELTTSQVAYRPLSYTPKRSYPIPGAQDTPNRVSSKTAVPATSVSLVRTWPSPSLQETSLWIRLIHLTSLHSNALFIFRTRSRSIHPTPRQLTFISGTLLDHSGRLSASAAKECKDRLSRAEVFRNGHSKRDGPATQFTNRDAWEGDVKRKLNFSITELRKNLDLCLLPSRCVVCLTPKLCHRLLTGIVVPQSQEDHGCIY